MITAHDKWKCAERELAMRRRVYAKWVAAGKMSESEARREIDTMEDIANDYELLAKIDEEQERLI